MLSLKRDNEPRATDEELQLRVKGTWHCTGALGGSHRETCNRLSVTGPAAQEEEAICCGGCLLLELDRLKRKHRHFGYDYNRDTQMAVARSRGAEHRRHWADKQPCAHREHQQVRLTPCVLSRLSPALGSLAHLCQQGCRSPFNSFHFNFYTLDVCARVCMLRSEDYYRDDLERGNKKQSAPVNSYCSSGRAQP